MNVEQAIEVVAQQAIQEAVRYWLEDGWENMPDIGQYDYERVAKRAKAMCPDAKLGDFDTALTVLEARAERGNP